MVRGIRKKQMLSQIDTFRPIILQPNYSGNHRKDNSHTIWHQITNKVNVTHRQQPKSTQGAYIDKQPDYYDNRQHQDLYQKAMENRLETEHNQHHYG
jgi:hypothetical protein